MAMAVVVVVVALVRIPFVLSCFFFFFLASPFFFLRPLVSGLCPPRGFYNIYRQLIVSVKTILGPHRIVSFPGKSRWMSRGKRRSCIPTRYAK